MEESTATQTASRSLDGAATIPTVANVAPPPKTDNLPTPGSPTPNPNPVAGSNPPPAMEQPKVVKSIPIPTPPYRRLQIYAFDPSVGMQMETAVLNRVVVNVPWEEVEIGPVGKYLEVVDIDPASKCAYEPVNLNDPYLLATDGLAPSDGNPQFHQQMVYAVAMTTIRNFEAALGRLALWSPRRHEDEPDDSKKYVDHLRIYPHALREANAYYSPSKKALLFGYFPASLDDPGNHLPGGTVFTCLSHDVVAHETTHALLDGMHRRFNEASNPDVLAFHEAFADICALFQHFSLPDVLRNQIARTRGDLAAQSLLGQLAQEFGQATGQHGALRDALGAVNKATGQWEPTQPDPTAMTYLTEPHARGALLVAAIFDAFLSIYKSRVADLLRIATGGTGILPKGDIHPDLVNRLAHEAAKSARHVLTMCIRALDYCPPVDITYGEYLRALITADYGLVPDDARNYRVAIIEAFRRRGIYPREMRTLSVDSLRWQSPLSQDRHPVRLPLPPGFRDEVLRWNLTADRKSIYEKMEEKKKALHGWFFGPDGQVFKPEMQWMQWQMGVNVPQSVQQNAPQNSDTSEFHVPSTAVPGAPTVPSKLEVHSVRPARRIGPDGQTVVNIVIEVAQKMELPLDANAGSNGASGDNPTFTFRGGCTLIVDVDTDSNTEFVRYCIAKNINSTRRQAMQRQFLGGSADSNTLRATYFGNPYLQEQREPFALLHRGESAEEAR